MYVTSNDSGSLRTYSLHNSITVIMINRLTINLRESADMDLQWPRISEVAGGDHVLRRHQPVLPSMHFRRNDAIGPSQDDV